MTSFFYIRGVLRVMIRLDKIKFVYISLDYLRELHKVDSEVQFEDTEFYRKKPHLGILCTCNNINYVIPLTSAKKKHANRDDVTNTNYRIYEIINIEKTKIKPKDVIADIKNLSLLENKNIPKSEWHKYKQRILSVLEIKKMIPVKEDVYTIVDLRKNNKLSKEDFDRINLMNKEYRFCLKIKKDIEKRANKIYTKQIQTGKVLKFHCDFKKLEDVMKNYIIPSKQEAAPTLDESEKVNNK